MDSYKVQHLDAWLDREIYGDMLRAKVRAAMIALVETDPEYYGAQSWWNVFDRVHGEDIRRAHNEAA